jgi:hypothetical protein
VRIIQAITGLVAAVALGAFMMDHSALPKRPILPLLLIVLVAYVVIRRD